MPHRSCRRRPPCARPSSTRPSALVQHCYLLLRGSRPRPMAPARRRVAPQAPARRRGSRYHCGTRSEPSLLSFRSLGGELRRSPQGSRETFSSQALGGAGGGARRAQGKVGEALLRLHAIHQNATQAGLGQMPPACKHRHTPRTRTGGGESQRGKRRREGEKACERGQVWVGTRALRTQVSLLSRLGPGRACATTSRPQIGLI